LRERPLRRGGRSRGPAPPPAPSARAVEIDHPREILVDGAPLRYRARTATGRLHDVFTITRKRDGSKTITEEAPQE
jgi:hypothetical protein